MTLALSMQFPFPPSRYWYPGPQPLYQGNVGACVGFTGANWMQNTPIKTSVLSQTGLDLYYACKKIDGLPPGVEGTYARILLKVLQAQGRVSRYLWATGPDMLKQYLLTSGPVLVGTPWRDGMFRVNSNGFVQPSGVDVGGHEYLVRGYSNGLGAFRCRNSWGAGWGIGAGNLWAGNGGEFWIDERHLYDLLWGARGWGDAIGIDEWRVC